jgi:NADPH:quinone reductase-like Zn-dependent oxidoreductase
MADFTHAFRFAAAGSPNRLAFDSHVPLPPVGSSDVRIRVRACSLNYRDLIHARRELGRDFTGQIPLSDGAGEIVEVGSAVAEWKIGDRVAGCFFPAWPSGRFDLKYHASALGGQAPGMLAREVVLPADGIVRIPAKYSFEEAACLPCAAVTVWQALVTRGDFRPGQSALVLGTGGVSIFALQFVVAMGGTAIVTSSSDEKLSIAKSLGATHTVNYRTTPDWDKAVWSLSGKIGVDHVVEVGGPGTLGKSLNAVAAGGQIHLIGVLTGAQAPDASLFPLVGRNVTMNGIYVGSRADFTAMNAFLETQPLRPVIDRVFTFGEANAALDHLESGSHFGKVVVTMS